jgi:hypothetical protein
MSCFLSYTQSVTGDCSNTNVGGFTINIDGQAPDYTIQWLSPDLGTIPLGESVTAYTQTNLSGGTYSFNIIDSCSPTNTIQAVNVYISTGTCVSIVDEVNTLCGFNNGSLTAQNSSYYDISEFYLYERTNGYITSGLSSDNSYTFNSLSPGIYYVIGDDGGGCTGKSETCIIKSSTTIDYGLPYFVNRDPSAFKLQTDTNYAILSTRGMTGHEGYGSSFYPSENTILYKCSTPPPLSQSPDGKTFSYDPINLSFSPGDDPVVMATTMFENLFLHSSPNVNDESSTVSGNNIDPNPYSECSNGGYMAAKEIFNQFLNGITFQTDIFTIRKSYSGSSSDYFHHQ